MIPFHFREINQLYVRQVFIHLRALTNDIFWGQCSTCLPKPNMIKRKHHYYHCYSIVKNFRHTCTFDCFNCSDKNQGVKWDPESHENWTSNSLHLIQKLLKRNQMTSTFPRHSVLNLFMSVTNAMNIRLITPDRML